MEEIAIVPGLNYIVNINGSEYYPGMLDVEFEDGKPYVKNEGKIGVHYFIRNQYNTHIVSKFRSIDSKLINNVKLPDITQEVPKIFLSRNLAEVLGICQSAIDKGLVKSVYEVPDYKKYFKIFAYGEEPKDRFSRFKGTALFPSKERDPLSKDYISENL